MGAENLAPTGFRSPDRPARSESLYRDDLVVMIKSESIRESENFSNVEMSKISEWAKEKIRFNEQKSKVMHMTRKRKESKELEIYLNDKLLLQVHRLKYLGIMFDSKLTFKEHINYMAEKM